MNLLSGLSSNKLFKKIALGIFIGTMAVCTFMGNLVKVSSLNIVQWMVIIGLGFIVIPIDILRKYITKRKKN